MKLFDLLKQFKNIEPDAGFTERSKRQILLTPQTDRRTMRGVFAFLHVLETGAAVVLAGFFILILTGSFSPTRSLAPIQYSVIDPQGLHAEAQAIDMQIQLADVEYAQVTSTAATASNGVVPVALNHAFSAAVNAQTSSVSTPPTTAPTSQSSTPTASTTALSVDQALQQLSH
jgi:hypothetical protein